MKIMFMSIIDCLLRKYSAVEDNKVILLKKLSLIASIGLWFYSLPTATAHNKEIDDRVITKLYKSLPANISQKQKLQWFSKQFINKPYGSGPLGEGDNGHYDQTPLYRTDRFDCLTYVETVMALNMAKDLHEFKRQIVNIRYQGDKPTYLQRNHFTSLNWNLNNIKKGYIKDITNTILNKHHQPIYKVATATIDKSAWLKRRTIKNIKIKDSVNTSNSLKQLHQHANQFSKQKSSINYLPLKNLFHDKKQANNFIFNQIPSGSIIEIIRPNWQMKNLIGTNLNVSHLGLVFRINKILYFREASSLKHRVTEVPLVAYLKNHLKSPTIKGISVFKINL